MFMVNKASCVNTHKTGASGWSQYSLSSSQQFSVAQFSLKRVRTAYSDVNLYALLIYKLALKPMTQKPADVGADNSHGFIPWIP